MLVDCPQGLLLNRRISRIDETEHACPKHRDRGTLVVCNARMEAYEGVERGLLEAHLGLGYALQLVDEAMGEDDLFVRIMRDAKRLIWILRRSSALIGSNLSNMDVANLFGAAG